jgi:hypothetical protein
LGDEGSVGSIFLEEEGGECEEIPEWNTDESWWHEVFLGGEVLWGSCSHRFEVALIAGALLSSEYDAKELDQ